MPVETYLPLVSGAELARLSGALTQIPAVVLIQALLPPAPVQQFKARPLSAQPWSA